MGWWPTEEPQLLELYEARAGPDLQMGQEEGREVVPAL